MFIIAHRGLSARYKENTLEAIMHALQYTSVVEIDLHCTKDDVPICCHDKALKRTHGLDIHVEDLTYEELQIVAPEIPTLESALHLISQRRGAVMLDVKIEDRDDIKAIKEVVKASNITWNKDDDLRSGKIITPLTATFQSANLEVLREIHDELGAGCLLLFRKSYSPEFSLKIVQEMPVYVQGVCIPDTIASHKLIECAHEQKLGVYVYTINSVERAKDLERLGADGIFTDKADTIRLK